MAKATLIKAAQDLRDGNGLAQTAINSLSGVIPEEQYKPFEKGLQVLQGKVTGDSSELWQMLTTPPGPLEGLAKMLDDLIAVTPDDPAQDGQ